jgi:hypothetical protein
MVHNNHPTTPGYKAIGICGHGYWVKFLVMRKTTREFIYKLIHNIQYGHFRTILEFLMLNGKEMRDQKQ